MCATYDVIVVGGGSVGRSVVIVGVPCCTRGAMRSLSIDYDDDVNGSW